MTKRFVVTTAVGLVLATASFAQSPSDSTKRQEQRNQEQRTSPPAATNPAPSTSSSQTQSAPSGGSAQSTQPATGAATKQGQAPATSGTAQSQPPQSTTGTAPAQAQPNTDRAQSPPAASQPSTAQSPAPTNQPSTAQSPAQSNQPTTAQSPTNRPATNSAQTPAQPGQPSTAQAPQPNTNVNVQANIGVQEQTRISQSIARLNVQPLTRVNFSVAVGTVVPRNVRLQTLPPDIVQVVPQYRGHSFVVVRDEIVIIEPSTYRIVAVLPKSGGRAAAAPSRAPMQARAQSTVKFTDKERAAIRKHVGESRERVTTGSSTRTQVRIGERVPETVRIREFPETVYREVPTVREYRYIDLDNRSYLVEPRERVIIEEID